MEHDQDIRIVPPKVGRRWISFIVLLRIGLSLLPSLSVQPFRNWFCKLREAYLSRRLPVHHYEESPTPNGIRLLRIQGWSFGILYCSLELVALDTCPKYTALSYTWASEDNKMRNLSHFWKSIRRSDTDGIQGSPQASVRSASSPPATRLIVCDGNSLRITPNLYNALSSIRISGQHNEYWWIDQVCIDQSNEDEKSLQVPLMGSIYRKASNVAVWLGNGYSWEIQALAFIPALLVGPPKAEIYRVLWNSTGACLYFALVNIVKRSWFHRVWIVQELMLAKNAVFFLGNHSIQYEALHGCISQVAQNNSGLGYGKASTDVFQESFRLLESCKHFKDGGDWTIEEWISTIRGHRAQDLRDHIYAGLSLLSEADRSSIHVDYHKSRDKVFRDATEHLLEKLGLDALTLAERGSEAVPLLDRATWEVNADSPTLRVPLLKLHENQYNACPRRVPTEFNFRVESDLLRVKALLVDEIDIVCSSSLLHTGEGVEDLIRIVLCMEEVYSGKGEPPLVSIVRALTVGAVLTPGSPFAGRRHGAQQDMATLIATTVECSRKPSNWQTNPLDLLKDAWPQYGRYDWNKTYNDGKHWMHTTGSQFKVPELSMELPSSEVSHHMLTATRQRRLFMTKKGLIGLGPTSTSKGQTVAILAGARVPYILNSVPLHLTEENLQGWDKALVQRAARIAFSEETIKPLYMKNASIHADWEKQQGTLRQPMPDLDPEEAYKSYRESIAGEAVSKEEWEKLDTIRSSMQLVGEAYLHGFMYGPTKHWLRSNAISWQDIYIQ